MDCRLERRHGRWALAAAVGGWLALAPAGAWAQNTCNAFIAIGYTAAQTFALPGDTVTVVLTLGSGDVQGGTQVTLDRVRFELDCDSSGPLGLGCTDDTAIVSYLGDATITTTCAGITFTSNVAGGGSATNQLVFDASPNLVIPENTPNFCTLSFDVQVLAQSTDPTPNAIEEVAGFSVVTSDALCDNGLASSGSQSGSIQLCPPCDDNNACTTEQCNQTTGTCETTDTTVCNDNNACTTEVCNTSTGACDTTSTTTCNDNNACTTEVCNTSTGACDTTATTTCNDNNACTTEVCNTSTGACDTTSTTTCNDNNACTTEVCNTSTGACDTTATVTCADPTCEVCDTATGVCEPRDPLPPECLPEIELICRTPGFWGTHADEDPKKECSQNITQAVIAAVAGSPGGALLNVCGEDITTTDVDDAASAVEALCVRVRGVQERQLARQLTAAALNCVVSQVAAGDPTPSGDCSGTPIEELWAECNALCADTASTSAVSDCIEALDCFNNGFLFDPVTKSCGESTGCHERDLPLGLLDLPNNDSSAGRCFGKQGPAGSNDECSAANATPCGILSIDEDECACDSAEGIPCP